MIPLSCVIKATVHIIWCNICKKHSAVIQTNSKELENDWMSQYFGSTQRATTTTVSYKHMGYFQNGQHMAKQQDPCSSQFRAAWTQMNCASSF